MRGVLRAGAFLLACAFLLAARAGAGPFEEQTIEAIRFRGNEQIGDRAIRAAMRLKQPVWWNPLRKCPYLGPDYLAIDLYRILDLYKDKGFPLATIKDAEVRSRGDGARVVIEIVIEEGPRYRVAAVSLEGVEQISAREAISRVGIRPGQRLSAARVRQAESRLGEYYGEGGFLRARVRADLVLRGDSARVIFRVKEGPIYAMREAVIDTAIGSDPTRGRVIKREVVLKRGETVRTSKVLRSQEQIYETGIFRTVRVMPVVDTTGLPVADLRINAHPRSSGWYGFGAGYSSDDRLRFLAEWGNRNLSGRARRLEANADVALSLDPNLKGRGLPLQSALGRIRFTEPWLFGTRTKSQSTLYHAFEELKTFDQGITGLEEILRRGIGRHSSFGLGITNKWVRTGDPSASRRTYVTRNLSSFVEEERRDNILDARRGSYTQLLAEYAGGLLGGRAEFSRWTATGSWYWPLRGRVVLATRARAGLIVPVGSGAGREEGLRVERIPFEERFRLGGGTTVRGYREDSLGRVGEDGETIGGSALFLGNAEVRFPLLWLLSGAAFLDGGNVWADVEEVNLDRFRRGFAKGARGPLSVRYGAGLGLRVATPVGPFRIDYGLKLGGGRPAGENPGEVHLSLGQAF